MDFMHFLKGLGSVIAKVFVTIKKIVPESQLKQAIALAQLAATKFVDNATRREWLVKELMDTLHINENLARWLSETAVMHLKQDAIDKAADAAKNAVDDPNTPQAD